MRDITTLLELLTDCKVVIPKIQRDYAQGRIGKESVLDSILTDVKEALDCKKVLTLDYIYGVTEVLDLDTRFYPLDGQQRLTTLWLVHWYFALKSGVLKDDPNWKKLIKFSYETRESSTDFCRALCSKEIKLDSDSIESYIKKQTWFYNSWIQDPTIKAMLHGLSIIEKHFADVTDYKKYWDILCKPVSDNDCRIKFEKLVFEEELIPKESADDLFIKMNARGKQLSEFENFKSDWVLSLTRNKDAYSKLIDNAWTDVFWKYARKTNNDMDKLFLGFINRYVLCKDMVLAYSGSFDQDDIKKIFQKKTSVDLQYRLAHSFRYIYDYEDGDKGYKGSGQEISNSKYPDYLTYLDYKDVLTDDSNMKEIESILSWYIIDSSSDSQNQSITVDLELNEKIEDICRMNGVELPFFGCESLEQKQRIYFYAVCKFMVVCSKLSKNRLVGLNRWMRIVRNLVLNSDVRSEQATYECLKIVDDLGNEFISKQTMDIYEILKDYKKAPTRESLRSKRLDEECSKAKRIKDDPSIIGLVHRAEDYAFFNGVITFLFDESAPDKRAFKERFISRFKKMRDVIDKDDENVNVDCIRQILKYYKDFDDILKLNIFIIKGFSEEANKPSFRDNILCGRLTSQECWGLTKDDPERKRREDLKKNSVALWLDGKPTNSDPDFEDFIDSDALEKIISDEGEKYICLKYGSNFVLQKIKRGNRYQGIIIRKEKSEALYKLGVIVTPEFEYISKCNLFWGLAVKFKYNSNDYVWGFDFDEKNPQDIIYSSEDWRGEKKNGKKWNLPDEIEGILKQF